MSTTTAPAVVNLSASRKAQAAKKAPATKTAPAKTAEPKEAKTYIATATGRGGK